MPTIKIFVQKLLDPIDEDWMLSIASEEGIEALSKITQVIIMGEYEINTEEDVKAAFSDAQRKAQEQGITAKMPPKRRR